MMIGFKIRTLREARNISREQMAEALELGLRTYGKIETNEREPTMKEIEIMAKEMKINAEDLQYGEPKMIFEKCTNQSFYNSGTVHFQNLEELKKYFDGICKQQQQIIEEQKNIIRQKDEVIAEQTQFIAQLKILIGNRN